MHAMSREASRSDDLTEAGDDSGVGSERKLSMREGRSQVQHQTRWFIGTVAPGLSARTAGSGVRELLTVD